MAVHPKSTVVFIEKLNVPFHIGVTEEERIFAQPVHIDVECELRDAVVAGDEVSQSLSYSTLAEKIRALAGDGRVRKLLETLAAHIADACLEDARIRVVVISLRKLGKIHDADAVGVTRRFIRMDQADYNR